MPDPSTPRKYPDGVQDIKDDLSARWGLRFPIPEGLRSPSSRNRERPEERAEFCLGFLIHRNREALHEALHEFENLAPQIISQWQFKTRAEPDVLPSREWERSGMRKDFMRRLPTLSTRTSDELMKSLEHVLFQRFQQHRHEQSYRMPELETEIVGQNPVSDDMYDQDVQDTTGSTSRQKSSRLASQTKDSSQDQPVFMSYHALPQGEFSSSDHYPDDDAVRFLQDIAMPDAPLEHKDVHSRQLSGGSDDDAFTTPPQSPSRRPVASLDLALTQNVAQLREPEFRKPSLPKLTTRKRLSSEAEELSQPRKISRDSTAQHPGREEMSVHIQNMEPINYNAPRQGVDRNARRSFGLRSSSMISLDGTDTNPSMNSSFTSLSSAKTTPATSFSFSSAAGSFESDTETDSTITPSQSRLSRRPLLPTNASDNAEMNAERLVLPEKEKDNRQAGEPMEMDERVSYPIHQGMEVPRETLSLNQPQAQTEADKLFSRLKDESPFACEYFNHHAKVPLRQLYEVSRVAATCKVGLESFSNCLTQAFEDETSLWSEIRKIIQGQGCKNPERSSKTAWNRAGEDWNGVTLSGKLNFLESKKGPLLGLSLLPLKVVKSFRLGRKFGSDRFCVLLIPGLDARDLPQHLKSSPDAFRHAFVRWLVTSEHKFLGRIWRAFFVRAEKNKKPRSKFEYDNAQSGFRVFLFAEHGDGFRCSPRQVAGEIDPRRPDHPHLSVKELIEWFMPSRNNMHQTSLKFFTRIALGLTSTDPTVQFKPHHILRRDDAFAESPSMWQIDTNRSDEKKTGRNPMNSRSAVMNDGCARLSKAAAELIASTLDLNYVPAVFQGRIAGAKGMWMTDPLGEEMKGSDGHLWIEITDSQLKFEGHDRDSREPDPFRITLDVSGYSKALTSSYLNFQLMPILLQGGVPASIFHDLLREDLNAKIDELKSAMEDGPLLRSWIQSNKLITAERLPDNSIEFQGAMPKSKPEKINFLLDHGFEPGHCQFLQKELRKIATAYCSRLKTKMNIGVGQSTSAYMIADPLGILEENEVHLCFSSSFRDLQSGFDQTMLHDMEILVARLPAHLPSDIQKVRAVFRTELRNYKDVIVFSSKGQTSLASKLSGGDYDGDKAWVCWDEKLVGPFRNTNVPDSVEAEEFGIGMDKTKVAELLAQQDDTNRFLEHAFDFALRPSMLGPCTTYHEGMCYANGRLDDPKVIQISWLLGHLVDSAKNGYRFDRPIWNGYLAQKGLPKHFPTPAYKNVKESRPKKGNLIDDLVFKTSTAVVDAALIQLNQHFTDVPSKDADIIQARNTEYNDARNDPELLTALNRAASALDRIYDFWKRNVIVKDEEEIINAKRRGSAISFASVAQKCREDFLAITPIDPVIPKDSSSSLLQRWNREHTEGTCSQWDLVKASIAYYKFFQGTFVWHSAGLELGEIKATARGRGNYRNVVNNLFETLKVDRKLVEKIRRRGQEDDVYDDLAEYDDDDEEYGDWNWTGDD